MEVAFTTTIYAMILKTVMMEAMKRVYATTTHLYAPMETAFTKTINVTAGKTVLTEAMRAVCASKTHLYV